MDQRLITVFLVLVAFPNVISYCHDENGVEQGEYCAKSPQEDIPEIRMLLVGKTGSGKSSTGNTLLGLDVFETSSASISKTEELQFGVAERFQRRLVVIDTPGLFDTGRATDDIFEKIKAFCDAVSFKHPASFAVLLVLKIGRLTAEEETSVKLLIDYFGDKVKQCLIIVFTGKSQLGSENMNIEDYIGTIDSRSTIKRLIQDIEYRYIALGLGENRRHREEEVQSLLKIIENINQNDYCNNYAKYFIKNSFRFQCVRSNYVDLSLSYRFCHDKL